jgi:hypothetical protein
MNSTIVLFYCECVIEVMWLGQVGREFQLFVLCLFVKEDVKQVKFHSLTFFINNSIAEQKKILLLCNWVYFVTIFLKLFSQKIFQCSINRLNCSQNVAFLRFVIFRGII